MTDPGEKAALLPEWELWACADQVMKQHGDGARIFAQYRIAELAMKGDEQGVRTWQAITFRIDQLAGDDRNVQ